MACHASRDLAAKLPALLRRLDRAEAVVRAGEDVMRQWDSAVDLPLALKLIAVRDAIAAYRAEGEAVGG
jgi:hypothetical protein